MHGCVPERRDPLRQESRSSATRRAAHTATRSRRSRGARSSSCTRSIASASRPASGSPRSPGTTTGTSSATSACRAPGGSSTRSTSGSRSRTSRTSSSTPDDRAIFVDPDQLPTLEKLAPALGRVRHIVVLGDVVPPSSLPNLVAYEDLIRGQPEVYPRREIPETEPLGLCYTSGTTGRPKGVVYTHRSTVLHSLGVTSTAALRARAGRLGARGGADVPRQRVGDAARRDHGRRQARALRARPHGGRARRSHARASA